MLHKQRDEVNENRGRRGRRRRGGGFICKEGTKKMEKMPQPAQNSMRTNSGLVVSWLFLVSITSGRHLGGRKS